MSEYFDAKMLKRVFLAGYLNLEANKEWINELNVFPVPDGDTGTNMSLTLKNAAEELRQLEDDADMAQVCKAIAQGTLRGARGNSGVIMSQLCRGLSKEFETLSEIDEAACAAAFERAQATAYKAVMKPKEGTILTVAKGAAAKARELCGSGLSASEYLSRIIEYAQQVLARTPDMLPVLKEAGVVDSGGQGLVVFLQGVLDGLNGKEISYETVTSEKEGAAAGGSRAVDSSSLQTSDIKFGYCTEFIINLEKEYSDKDDEDFKAFLESIGDSIVCVSMDDCVKVHVHTNHPGQAIERALEMGSLSRLKIDNMREEHHEKVIKESDKKLAKKQEEEKKNAQKTGIIFSDNKQHKDAGFIAVCSGSGFCEVFQGMSVDAIIEGGQTMNPSTDSFLSALEGVNADTVFILPNNGNIILAAEQAKAVCENKDVRVIPTKSVAQGISALFGYVSAKSAEENEKAMCEAFQNVKCAEVTNAVRTTTIGGVKVKKGDFMCIDGKEILSCGKDRQEVCAKALKSMIDDRSEIVTIYYGEGVEKEDAFSVADCASKLRPDIEVCVIYGGQPVYSYIISVE